MKVILSSTIILEPGTFSVDRLTLMEAKAWVEDNKPTCFSMHETVKILGIPPSSSRESCSHYTEALCLKPNQRLNFNRSYSLEEIEAIGVRCFIIKKL